VVKGGDGTTTNPPVTSPVPLTEATAGDELLQMPPGTISLNCVVMPEHIEVPPVIGAGSGFTVTVVVIVQPVANV